MLDVLARVDWGAVAFFTILVGGGGVWAIGIPYAMAEDARRARKR